MVLKKKEMRIPLKNFGDRFPIIMHGILLKLFPLD